MKKIFAMLSVASACIFAGCSTSQSNKEQKAASEMFLSHDRLLDTAEFSQRYPREKCISSLGQKKSVSKSVHWKAVVNNLNACVALEKWNLVESQATTLLETSPHSPWGPYFLSLASSHRKDFGRALWMLQLAEKKTRSVAIFELQRARILYGLERVDQALKSAELALKQDATLVSAALFIGDIYYRNEDYKMARRYFEKGLKQNAKDPGITLKLGEISYLLQDFSAARDYFERSRSKGSKSVHLFYRLGDLLKNQFNDLEQALRAYREGMAIQQSKSGLDANFNFSEQIKDVERLLLEAKTREVGTNRMPSDEKSIEGTK